MDGRESKEPSNSVLSGVLYLDKCRITECLNVNWEVCAVIFDAATGVRHIMSGGKLMNQEPTKLNVSKAGARLILDPQEIIELLTSVGKGHINFSWK